MNLGISFKEASGDGFSWGHSMSHSFSASPTTKFLVFRQTGKKQTRFDVSCSGGGGGLRGFGWTAHCSARLVDEVQLRGAQQAPHPGLLGPRLSLWIFGSCGFGAPKGGRFNQEASRYCRYPPLLRVALTNVRWTLCTLVAGEK